MEGLNSLGVLELLRPNEACRALVFPLHSEVQISKHDVISLLEHEGHQGRMRLEEYVQLSGREVTFLVILTQSFHFSEPCGLVQCLQNILSILLLMIFVVISGNWWLVFLSHYNGVSVLPSEAFCYQWWP